MDSLKESPANHTKLDRVDASLRLMLGEVLRHGVYGLATLELVIADGPIQRISRRVEQFER